jgi:arginase
MPREIAVLGVPMDLGQGRRGVDMGPSALRYGRLERLGHTVRDLGDIDADRGGAHPAQRPGRRHGLSTRSEASSRPPKLLELAPEQFPIVLGGDH